MGPRRFFALSREGLHTVGGSAIIVTSRAIRATPGD